MVEICEKGDAAVLRSIVEGHLHGAEVVILPAADAPEHVVCKPPLLTVTCTASKKLPLVMT